MPVERDVGHVGVRAGLAEESGGSVECGAAGVFVAEYGGEFGFRC